MPDVSPPIHHAPGCSRLMAARYECDCEPLCSITWPGTHYASMNHYAPSQHPHINDLLPHLCNLRAGHAGTCRCLCGAPQHREPETPRRSSQRTPEPRRSSQRTPEEQRQFDVEALKRILAARGVLNRHLTRCSTCDAYRVTAEACPMCGAGLEETS